jgi:mRNA interferase MazF
LIKQRAPYIPALKCRALRRFFGKLPGEYDDWLICMISSQTRHYLAGFDEVVREGDEDFEQSGLKVASVIRAGRLAVVSGDLLLGAIGEISRERLERVRQNIAKWLLTMQNGG